MSRSSFLRVDSAFWMAAGGGACLGLASATSWLWLLVFLGAATWARAAASCWERSTVVFGVIFAGSLAMHASSTAWIFNALNRDGANGPATVALLGLMFFGGLAAVHAACCLMAKLFVNKLGLTSPRGSFSLAFVLAWSANDWFRQSGQFAFPYLQLGPSLIDAPGAAGWFPLVGAEGLSVMVLAPLAWAAGSTMEMPWPHKHSASPWLKAACFLSAMAITGHGLSQIHWTHATTSLPLSVIGMQSNFTRASKWTDESRAHAFGWLTQTASQAPAGSVLITPEFFLFDPVQLTPARELDSLQNLARQRNIDLLIGVPYAVKPVRDNAEDPASPKFLVFNSILQLSPHRSDLYGKEQLVPYGEYAPLARWLAPIYRDVFDFPLNNLSPAPEQLHDDLFVGGMTVGASICFEVAFPRVMARRARNAQWLLAVTNNGWFDSSMLDAQTHMAARVRAVENGKMLMAVNNVGITALHGVDGKVKASLSPGKEALLAVSVTPYTGVTPYGWLCNLLPGASTLLALMCFGGWLRRHAASHPLNGPLAVNHSLP